MSPLGFIRKNIVQQLMVEGFSEQVARGGRKSGLIIIGAALRQPVKAQCTTTAFSVPASGRWGRPQLQSAKQAKKSRARGQISIRPFLTLLVHTCNGTNFYRSRSMKNNTNKHPNVSSANAENQPVITGIAITRLLVM